MRVLKFLSKRVLQYRRWQAQCCLVKGEKGSWLRYGKGCYGCVACQYAGSSGAYGRFKVKDIGLCNLLLHQKSKLHQQHVDIYLRRPGAIIAAGAPSIADFKAVWHLVVEKGASASKSGLPGVGGGRKVRKCVRCLAVGIKTLDQKFLAKSKSKYLRYYIYIYNIYYPSTGLYDVCLIARVRAYMMYVT